MVPVKDSHNILVHTEMDKDKLESVKGIIYNIFLFLIFFASTEFYCFRVKPTKKIILAKFNDLISEF